MIYTKSVEEKKGKKEMIEYVINDKGDGIRWRELGGEVTPSRRLFGWLM